MKLIFPVISNLESKERRLNIIHSLSFRTNNARAGAHTFVLHTDQAVGMSCGRNSAGCWETLSLSNMSWLPETSEVLASSSAAAEAAGLTLPRVERGGFNIGVQEGKKRKGYLGSCKTACVSASCSILFFTGKEKSVKQKEKCHYLFVYKFWF